MVADVKRYVADQELPPGYEMVAWGDQSIEVADRLDMLARNGLQGLMLVFLLLAVFLELRLAFWVALGIPVSILGTCAVLYFGGHTLNMLTSFAFLMVLGHPGRRRDRDRREHLCAPPARQEYLAGGHRRHLRGAAQRHRVGRATTVIAFVPLLFVAGVMGKFLGVMPRGRDRGAVDFAGRSDVRLALPLGSCAGDRDAARHDAALASNDVAGNAADRWATR